MIKKLSFFISIILFGSAFGQKDKEVLQKQNADLKKQISTINASLIKPNKSPNFLLHI